MKTQQTRTTSSNSAKFFEDAMIELEDIVMNGGKITW